MTLLKIKTHSGSEFEAEVQNYNAAEVNEKLNRNDVNTVAFGDIIVSRIDVKSVVPVEVPPIEEPPTEEDPIVDEPPIEDETSTEPIEE
ncbi:hypothetical protein C2I17_21205 [Niallia circulans]|uniref:hypothetical protein n=1 Tax=Niallia circulans TaxID=1397 RepID=UPI00201D898D|nr:hypothetical protein [Niallia circulans]UQZ76858.1 hypothetical protein C2I17_21205 [Niallia circulans]